MSLALTAARDEPLSEINTTPLIDVMLVMLVMLILTLPPTTNTMSYPLPTSVPGLAPNPVENTVAITASDMVTWNGQPVSDEQLASSLTGAVALKPEPELRLAPDAGASYDKSAHVLRLIKLSGATNVGFVGNERYRLFGTGGPRNPTASPAG
jgi:biopolymer transport protein ExbD